MCIRDRSQQEESGLSTISSKMINDATANNNPIPSDTSFSFISSAGFTQDQLATIASNIVAYCGQSTASYCNQQITTYLESYYAPYWNSIIVDSRDDWSITYYLGSYYFSGQLYLVSATYLIFFNQFV
eukprot:TRINITY_DN16905_c0_g1_i1.p2 TRINITY_DN16905_c0_g1~~TRINITY_DN16905_c0_g1_i1.p2  ORF type:complete len:128 (+),score=26.97 TRINITY_DN16905_c0_g1_i1:95-478(+)